MIRVIVLFIVVYILYRLVRSWVRGKKPYGRMRGTPVDRIDDVMVKDPQCGVYFPRRDGIVFKRDEGDLLFCSRECRDKYLSGRSGSK